MKYRKPVSRKGSKRLLRLLLLRLPVGMLLRLRAEVFVYELLVSSYGVL